METILISRPNIYSYSCHCEYLKDMAQFNKTKNKYWSYANWVRKLELKNKSSLAMIISGKRNPGASLLEKFNSVLDLTPDEWTYFKRLVNNKKKNTESILRIKPEYAIDKSNERPSLWLELVILDLCQLSDFQDDAAWIKNRILKPVSIDEIDTVLDLMKKNNFLVINNSGELAPNYLEIKNVTKSLAESDLFKLHEDANRAGAEALARVQKDQRQFLTSILRVSTDKIPEANEILQDAQKKLTALLESKNGQQVYELHLHLFPITNDKIRSTSSSQ